MLNSLARAYRILVVRLERMIFIIASFYILLLAQKIISGSSSFEIIVSVIIYSLLFYDLSIRRVARGGINSGHVFILLVGFWAISISILTKIPYMYLIGFFSFVSIYFLTERKVEGTQGEQVMNIQNKG